MPDTVKRKQNKRSSGILLPVSSLPSDYGIGAFGSEAFRFIDFLKSARQKYWQILPLGPTSIGDSPYQSFSAFAGNPYFIDLNILIEEGLITKEEAGAFDWGNRNEVDYSSLFASRYKLLRMAYNRSRHSTTQEYETFCRENAYWLKDYSLYMALKFHFDQQAWWLWPEDIRFYEDSAVRKYEEELKSETDFWEFLQFKFSEQWKKVKDYANHNDIKVIGDIPIYVALDSADVWSHSELFQLDAQRRPVKVSGVPPDAFSKKGQLWGNPLYDWSAMERQGFDWWKKRMEYSAKIYDKMRIDHFIGIVQYYAIPAGETTAVNGSWETGPGLKLTNAINSSVGKTRIIAEDLGVVAPEVKRLLKKTGYPGMRVLQFAFEGGPQNEHLPCHYTNNMVAYSGTHDNNTLVGFFDSLKRKHLKFAKEYLHVKKKKELPQAAIRALYASVADTVILQAQDILMLPAGARMNFPSTIGNNWRWRLEKNELSGKLAKELERLTIVYDR
ncbi:MAG: 4-alpha-glucanotransferase [Eubacteriales bacterium]|jgi:4-alpha-glucanotransferase